MRLINGLISVFVAIAPASMIHHARNAWSAALRRLPMPLNRYYRQRKWGLDIALAHFPLVSMSIETVGNCNRDCVYCPVSVFPKRKGRMPTDIFQKVILELKALGYKNEIFLHFYNEPLLDTRILDFLTFVHEHLPANPLPFVTNGDLLTLEKTREIFAAGATLLRVSIHDRDLVEKIRNIEDQLTPAERRKFTSVHFYDLDNNIYTSRAGTVAPKANEYKTEPAAFPQGCDKVEYHVDYLGQVHPCPEDMENGYVLGNVNSETLLEIWERNRQNFYDHFTGNYTRDICKRCAGVACGKTTEAAAATRTAQ